MTTTTSSSSIHPTTAIYVGDLQTDVSEGLLFEIFKRIGPVQSIRVCRDSLTKRSLGYAYVNFVNIQDAQRAIDTLNNTQIKGKPCRVMFSIRDPSIRKSGKGNIFIRNLDTIIKPKELHDTFSQFGNIISCKVATYPNGESKGLGYVHFENPENAAKAIEIVNNKRIGEKTVAVCEFVPRHERQKRAETTWTNVFVKNLDNEIDEKQIEDLFRPFGNITSRIVMRNDRGNFGFVNFQSHEMADRAVKEMNGYIYKNRTLYVSRAQKRSERETILRKEYEMKRRERIRQFQGLNLYVKNIEEQITEDKLRKEFEPYGTITSIKIMTNDRGNSKGFGFVCYSTQQEAQRAITEIGKNRILPGCSKPLYVAIHEPREIRHQRLYGRGRRNKNQNYQQNQVYGHPQQVPPFAPYFNQPPPPYGPKVVYSNPQSQGFPIQGYMQQPNVNQQSNQVQSQQRNPNIKTGGRKQPDVIGEIMNLPLEQQRQQLGNALYERISQREPQLASKITGMILGSGEGLELIIELINDPIKLETTLNDAKNIILKGENNQ